MADTGPLSAEPRSLLPTRDPAKSARLMAALDAVNARFGRGALRPLSSGIARPGPRSTGACRHAGPRNKPLLAMAVSYGIRRLVAATDSVAAPRSKAEPEMFRASTRTVLFDQTTASSSMKRVEEASEASARSPCRAPATVTSTRCTATRRQ